MSKRKEPKKNPIAQAMNALRNKKMPAARRKEIAQRAAQARWAKKSDALPAR